MSFGRGLKSSIRAKRSRKPKHQALILRLTRQLAEPPHVDLLQEIVKETDRSKKLLVRLDVK